MELFRNCVSYWMACQASPYALQASGFALCASPEARDQKNCFPKWPIHIIILGFLYVLHQARYLSSHAPNLFIIKDHGYPSKSYWRSLFDRIQSFIFDPIIPFFSAPYAL